MIYDRHNIFRMLRSGAPLFGGGGCWLRWPLRLRDELE
jgi:hypothetical protein